MPGEELHARLLVSCCVVQTSEVQQAKLGDDCASHNLLGQLKQVIE